MILIPKPSKDHSRIGNNWNWIVTLQNYYSTRKLLEKILARRLNDDLEGDHIFYLRPEDTELRVRCGATWRCLHMKVYEDFQEDMDTCACIIDPDDAFSVPCDYPMHMPISLRVNPFYIRWIAIAPFLEESGARILVLVTGVGDHHPFLPQGSPCHQYYLMYNNYSHKTSA